MGTRARSHGVTGGLILASHGPRVWDTCTRCTASCASFLPLITLCGKSSQFRRKARSMFWRQSFYFILSLPPTVVQVLEDHKQVRNQGQVTQKPFKPMSFVIKKNTEAGTSCAFFGAPLQKVIAFQGRHCSPQHSKFGWHARTSPSHTCVAGAHLAQKGWQGTVSVQRTSQKSGHSPQKGQKLEQSDAEYRNVNYMSNQTKGKDTNFVLLRLLHWCDWTE